MQLYGNLIIINFDCQQGQSSYDPFDQNALDNTPGSNAPYVQQSAQNRGLRSATKNQKVKEVKEGKRSPKQANRASMIGTSPSTTPKTLRKSMWGHEQLAGF
jgi:hypothetical protein